MTDHRDYRIMGLETLKLLALAGEPEVLALAVEELYRRAGGTLTPAEYWTQRKARGSRA